jgi:hypothetical protein
MAWQGFCWFGPIQKQLVIALPLSPFRACVADAGLVD